MSLKHSQLLPDLILAFKIFKGGINMRPLDIFPSPNSIEINPDPGGTPTKKWTPQVVFEEESHQVLCLL